MARRFYHATPVCGGYAAAERDANGNKHASVNGDADSDQHAEADGDVLSNSNREDAHA